MAAGDSSQHRGANPSKKTVVEASEVLIRSLGFRFQNHGLGIVCFPGVCSSRSSFNSMGQRLFFASLFTCRLLGTCPVLDTPLLNKIEPHKILFTKTRVFVAGYFVNTWVNFETYVSRNDLPL